MVVQEYIRTAAAALAVATVVVGAAVHELKLSWRTDLVEERVASVEIATKPLPILQNDYEHMRDEVHEIHQWLDVLMKDHMNGR